MIVLVWIVYTMNSRDIVSNGPSAVVDNVEEENNDIFYLRHIAHGQGMCGEGTMSRGKPCGGEG